MKLEAITSRLLREATDLYLAVAYRDEAPPERVLEIAAVDPSAPLAAALESGRVERIACPDHPGMTDKYRWRLGNARYPHMKLGLERCSDADDFVFMVDTHDRDFPVGSPALQSPEFRDLLSYNAEIKRAIEARWREAGIPTFADRLTRHLHHSCTLGTGHGKTILIVDDEEAILELEQELLEEAGYRVIPAASGFQAIGHLDHHDAVDLCLIDVMMPNLDGLTTAQYMRSRSHPRFPIVFLTALPRDRVPAGIADEYVGKPFDPDHLLKVIRRYIG